MTQDPRFPIIRQVIIGAGDIEQASQDMRDTFGLVRGMTDPVLHTMDMSDEIFRVGPEAHLELVGPLKPEAPIATWAAKVGGGSGYGLAIQVHSLDPYLANAEKLGVRVVGKHVLFDYNLVHLHPGDLGLFIELDEIPDADAWYWDDMESEIPDAPLIDDVLAVEVASPDPEAQALQWATLFGIEVEHVDGQPRIQLGTRTIRFAHGDLNKMPVVDVKVVDGREAPSSAAFNGVTFNLR